MPPDYRQEVERVHKRHPKLLAWNSRSSCGEFLQRVVHEINNSHQLWGTPGEVGLLTKPGPGLLIPNGYTFPNGTKTSVDVIAFQNGERVDVINGAGVHPIPAGPSWINIPQISPETGENQWRDSDKYVAIRSWPVFDSDAPDEVTKKVSELGRGWFCFIRALMDWPDEVERNWQQILERESPGFFRIMLAVEGQFHVRPGSSGAGKPDPWADAAVMITDPRYDATFKRAIDKIGAAGLQAWCTVYGGRSQTPTAESRHRFHDRIVQLLQGRWPAIRGFEMMNEYRVNGWTEEEVIDAGRDLQSKIPSGTVLALSAPHPDSGGTVTNEQMLSAMQALYGHGVGNRMTIHRDRDRASKWNDPFAYNTLMPQVPKEDNEPSGPGAFAGTSDPQVVVEQYVRASEARWTGHTAHASWCVFNGHMPQVWLDARPDYRFRFLYDMPGMQQISSGLRQYRQTGTVVVEVVPGPDPDPDPDPEIPAALSADRHALLAGQFLERGQRLVSQDGRATLDLQPDGNLVAHHDGQPVRATMTNGSNVGRLEMQADGNLVLKLTDGTPVRATQTHGHNGAMAQINGDGNLVVYEDPNGPRRGTALWDWLTREF